MAIDGVGFAADELARFSALDPTASFGETLAADAEAATGYFRAGQALIDRLPARASRSEREQAAAEGLHRELRGARTAFLRRHAWALRGPCRTRSDGWWSDRAASGWRYHRHRR